MKPKCLTGVYVAVLDLLRSSTLLTRVIYGVRVERKILSLNWDLTTIVLKKAIDTEFGAAARDVLDMGCGHLAILGQYIKKRHPESRVTSVDIYQELLDNAALNARENAVAISFVRSDLYENVKGPTLRTYPSTPSPCLIRRRAIRGRTAPKPCVPFSGSPSPTLRRGA